MISHDLRVVFVHIPKAAGTSVELALGHHGAPAAGGPAGEEQVRRGAQDHRTVRQLQWRWAGPAVLRGAGNRREAARGLKAVLRPAAHAANRLTVTREQWARYCTFTVVRNPWTRVHSAYVNVATDPLHRARWGVPDGIAFGEFLDRFGHIDLLRTQTSWVVDFHGRVGVDQVCRFEHLDRDLDAVRAATGLADLTLPHAVRGAGGEHLDAYDDRTRRLVADRYRDEIARFGYAFDDGGA